MYLGRVQADGLSNAASDSLRAILSSANPDGPTVVTGDFVLEDRSTRVPNMGRIDGPDEWRKYIRTAYEVGEPQFTLTEVVAVRGERAAAVRILVDYGDGYASQDGVVGGCRPRAYLRSRVDRSIAMIAAAQYFWHEFGPCLETIRNFALHRKRVVSSAQSDQRLSLGKIGSNRVRLLV